MKPCSVCGSISKDQDASCGVCGAGLAKVRTLGIEQRSSIFDDKVRTNQVHLKGLAVLVAGVGLLASGLYVLVQLDNPWGFDMIILGTLSALAILDLFNGLPYTPNTGWHKAGDPDIVATNTRGSLPSNYSMYLTDRELEAREKQNRSD